MSCQARRQFRLPVPDSKDCARDIGIVSSRGSSVPGGHETRSRVFLSELKPLRHLPFRDALDAGQWKTMRLKIAQAGEPVLRAQARQLTREEIVSDEIRRLIRDMHETMRDAPGVGLAAPQVGVALQLALIEDREELLSSLPAEELAEKERKPVPFHVIINPEITLLERDTADFYEGCLSVSGFSAVVPRARTVRVAYLDEQGEPQSREASGWYARILQHEIDHLQGTLYIDRMESRTFTSLDNWSRFWKGKPVRDIVEGLSNPFGRIR
jgi:peptide deformylase